MTPLPLIFDIRRCSLDDGPGLRTTVFLKGCPLNCLWCHNPEGISRFAEVVYRDDRCIHCGNCARVCPNDEIRNSLPGPINEEDCRLCRACLPGCIPAALQTSGFYYPPERLIAELVVDVVFYETSGGGVTFSGGEPTMHTDYLSTVMRGLKADNVHIALETAGTFEFEEFEAAILPFVDIIYFDLKLIDRQSFRTYTGGDNRRILENFFRLASAAKTKLIATVPLVPQITATRENLMAIAHTVADSGCGSWILRPYNPGGLDKRKRLRMLAHTKLPSGVLSKEERWWAEGCFREVIGECVHRATVEERVP